MIRRPGWNNQVAQKRAAAVNNQAQQTQKPYQPPTVQAAQNQGGQTGYRPGQFPISQQPPSAPTPPPAYQGVGGGNNNAALRAEYERRLAAGNTGDRFLQQHPQFAQQGGLAMQRQDQRQDQMRSQYNGYIDPGTGQWVPPQGNGGIGAGIPGNPAGSIPAPGSNAPGPGNNGYIDPGTGQWAPPAGAPPPGQEQPRDGYGGRIDAPPGTVHTQDFRDSDGDGVDDRYQTGPGQPGQQPGQRPDQYYYQRPPAPPGQGYQGPGGGNNFNELAAEYQRRLDQGWSGNKFMQNHPRFAQRYGGGGGGAPFRSPRQSFAGARGETAYAAGQRRRGTRRTDDDTKRSRRRRSRDSD